jgi:hypothetical protein
LNFRNYGERNMNRTFASKVIGFYQDLDLNSDLPEGVFVMNPYKKREIRTLMENFFNRYCSDENPRTFILGINPGRFGAGVTGITFTDPVRLESECGIANDLDKRPELSSVFIYDIIDHYGGTGKFYAKFYLSAVCPLGFVKEGKNLNYYDNKILERTLRPFIIRSIRDQIDFGCNRKTAICLGEGENFRYLSRLNSENRFFETIIPLAHPRFIMQYRLKKKEEYIQAYLDVLNRA